MLISPTSTTCLPRPEEETVINSGGAGKTAYSSKEGRKNQQVIPATSVVSSFFLRSGGLTVITRCCLFSAALTIFLHSVLSDALFRNGQVMAKLKPNTVFAE